MLRGATDLSHLSIEWQRVVVKILDIYKRIQFGIQINDRDLDQKEKLAIECCQEAIVEKSKDK